MDEWMYVWMDVWTDGWMDGWISICLLVQNKYEKDMLDSSHLLVEVALTIVGHIFSAIRGQQTIKHPHEFKCHCSLMS
jgi:hypothetical protein